MIFFNSTKLRMLLKLCTRTVKTMYEAVQNSVEKVAAGLQVDVSQKTSNQIVIIIMIILFMALMVVSAA